MNKLVTKDNIIIQHCYSRFNPNEPQDGMAPAMAYQWVKLPNRNWYRVQRFRNTIQLKNLIENRNIDEMEILVDTEVL